MAEFEALFSPADVAELTVAGEEVETVWRCEHPESWPLDEILPLVRRDPTTGAPEDAGFIVRADGVFAGTCEPLPRIHRPDAHDLLYPSFEELAADGWRVD